MATEPSAASPLRAILFLGVAAIAGSVSLVALHHLVVSYETAIETQRKPEDTVMVMVAARDLYQGITIAEDDLYAIEIPPRYLAEGVFLSPDHVVGRIPRERVLANEFVRSSRLANPESGIGMNAVIPRGMRALSVNISDGRALSGFLNPGNYVDLLVSIVPEGGDAELETTTLLQAVFVLGVNSRMGDESREDAKRVRGRQQQYRTVTLLVSAEQAEEVAFAENQGDLRLLLRNQDDIAANPVPGVDMDKLLGRLTPIAEIEVTRIKEVRPERTSVVIIKGDERETEVYEDGKRVRK